MRGLSGVASRDPLVFGGVDYPFETSHVLVIGVPFEATTSYKPGTRFGPEAIRRAAANIEFYSARAGIDVEEVAIHDAGDVPVSSLVRETLARVEEAAAAAARYAGDRLPVFLGGEHTITYGVVRGLRRSLGGDICLAVVDAHLDLREEYLGDPYSHACVMRRVAEEGLALPAYYGVRAYTRQELLYAREKGMLLLGPLEPGRRAGEALASRLLDGRCRHLHISVDMDGYDPAYAPGVGNPEPEGLTPTQVFDMLHTLVARSLDAGLTLSLDVVETSPVNDCNDITSVLAAKTVVETVAAWWKGRGRG